ncbi:HAMP domain-containing histidine kinase [Bacillus sp. ISL-47]|uniref:HAMP domain-containing sensor histidine kinase n=1 Tax=Bacillus sp. ISL-47 TaxID=2819130 RepID=UPI001BEA4790|nr:HAMP domain-containing sensor histidine kinase [Bacillus sp. ISL-47]MBT2691295.1 HAMP domain-containing histidine kinase [Bacillus sp. ISL-47]MBT2710563.1 HAMP domain-containing histidine kinase [Pseudomonas sp. ISL-84]
MRLKIKLPLLFLLMFMLTFVLIGIFLILYIKTLVADEGHMWQGNIFSPLHFQMLFFLSILMGLMFVVLTVFFHFNITKPIQTLNLRLKKVNIGNFRTPLHSRRKDEIGDLYNHFNEMEERLYQAHREQVDMIAAIAHDLKTPLTTITGFVELLSIQKDLTKMETQDYYELIMKKTKHMVGLIDAFSMYTKNEAMFETIDMKPIAIHKLFDTIASEYETELSGFDFKLTWKHTFNPNQLISINEHMIRRVFGNLFSNAVRYGNNNDLHVYLTGYAQEGYAYFQLEDNGVGVPNQDLSSLFHKFFTVDKSRQMNNGGSGLGLASCKLIIEYHGGQINAFHSDHGGLGIRFTLPLSV